MQGIDGRAMTTTSERLRRAEEIFLRVADLPAPEREPAIARWCGTDEALAREVRSLLRHSERLGTFLEEPALGPDFVLLPPRASSTPVAAVEPDAMVGRAVGRYRIERRIASGGMGTVYLASRADEQFAQRVAIKIVKRGMDSEEILERFRRERQTLAALEHPSIARLIDGGATEEGLPYLVMEYVEGQPIDAYCDDRRLGVDQRLELFLMVCDAVRHAHQNLVVHRDLKPGNILVTPEGHPKLLDFGIATVIAAGATSSVTSAHTRRLTPEYASPEQVAGAVVTTTSDVYSLGVVLCELLTGQPPYRFTTRTPAEVRRTVAEDAPRPPSTLAETADVCVEAARARRSAPRQLARRLRGDLDTIVLSALRKEPERRYPSVEALAADIRRHLQQLPVSARRDTVLYRTGKFMRRHTLVTALGLLSILLLAGGVAAFAWQARVAERQRDEAVIARAQSEAITSFLQRMLESADPSASGPSVTVRAVLDDAARRLDGELAGQPLVQASLHFTIGRTYFAMGLYTEAEAHHRAALRLRLDSLGPRHPDIAASEERLAGALHANHEFDEAATLLQAALEIYRAEKETAGTDVARVLSSLGIVREDQDDLDEAERLQREALRIRREIGGPDDLEVGRSLNNLAGLLHARARLDEALPLMKDSLRIHRLHLGEENRLVAQCIDNLASILSLKGDLDSAEPLYRDALELEMRILGPDHPDVAITQQNLAKLLIARKQFPEAEDLLDRCLDVRIKSLPVADTLTLVTRLDLANVLLAQGEEAPADALIEEALEATKDLAPDTEARSVALTQAARYYETRGLPERAAQLRAMGPPR